MQLHHLDGQQYGKAIADGVHTAARLSAIAITTMRTGVSPLPPRRWPWPWPLRR